MRAKSSGTTSMATISAPASSARWASSGPERSSASRRETLLEMVMTTVRTAPDDSRGGLRAPVRAAQGTMPSRSGAHRRCPRLARARGARRRGAAHAARPARRRAARPAASTSSPWPATRRTALRRPTCASAPRKGDHPSGRGIARLASAEPLQPGETVSLRWRHPSADAVLSVTAMAPQRPRRVILDLRARPESVDVTAQADGSLRGRHARRQRDASPRRRRSTCPGSRARRTPRPRSCWARSIAWSARRGRCRRCAPRSTARCSATTSCSSAIRSATRARAAWASSSSATRTSRGRRRPSIAARRSPIHGGRARAAHDARRIATTPYSSSDPTRLTVRARVLLVRDGAGIWRLATVEPLLPLVAVEHRRAFTDAELARLYRHGAAEGRKAVADAARRDAAREAATVDAAGPAPCAVPWPAIRRATSSSRRASSARATRRRAPASTSSAPDGPAAAWRCARRGPAARASRCRCSTRATARSRSASPTAAWSCSDTTDEDAAPKPLPGAAAHLDPDGLVVAAAGRPVGSGHRDARRRALGDQLQRRRDASRAARARRGPSRRCARPTCSAAPPPRCGRRARGP